MAPRTALGPVPSIPQFHMIPVQLTEKVHQAPEQAAKHVQRLGIAKVQQ